MSNPKVGVGSFIGFGEQSGYTTAVSRTKFLPMTSGGDSVNREDVRIETGGIDSIGFSSTRYRQGRRNIAGQETVEVLYEGTELLWKHLFGEVTTSQPNPGSQPTVYDHTFTIADTLPTGLSLELNRGGTSFLITGAKISQAQLSLNVDQYMRMALSFIGRDMDTASASSESIPTVNGWAAPDVTLRWNNSAQQVQSWNLNFNNSLDDNRVFIGSKLRSEPVRGARLSVTGSMEVEFVDTTLWTDFINATQRELIISAVGDQIGATGYYYSWTLTLPIAVFNTHPINVSSEGRVLYSADFKSYRSSSYNEATLVIRNTVTSV